MNGLAGFKRQVRNLLGGLPLGRRLLNAYGRYRLNQQAARFGDAKAFFTHIYETNLWGEAESASGPGSTIAYTENLRQELEKLLERLNAVRILDAPCGDFNWFRLVRLPSGAIYVGGDIVEPLVKRNTAEYATDARTFRLLDIRRDALPASDIWVCRDVLFHMSNADIFDVIANFCRCDIEYLLTSTHPNCQRNTDIPTGSYRDLNLEIAPFHFPPPLVRIDDSIAGFPARQMCLWRRTDLVAGDIGKAPANS